MTLEDDEERALRSVALENARSILAARQRVERELFAERERLRITLASIGDGVISSDPEGRVVFLNAVAERLTGWSQLEAAGQPLSTVFRIVNEATRAPVDNPALRALAEERIVQLANHTLLIARDGSERPIEDSAAPIRNEAGKAVGAVLVFRDVTERQLASRAKAQLVAIIESSEDAILSKTLDGVIQSWNAGAERVFGYRPEETIGKHITLLIPPDRHAEEDDILARLKRGERIEHFETVRVTKDGRHIDISISVSPMKDQQGTIIGAAKIARDITRRKQVEAALRAAEAQQRFFAALLIATQQLTRPDDVMSTTTRLLAEHLKVERCTYAEVEDQSVFVVTGDYNRGVPSIVGRWEVAAFGVECQRCMLANEPYVIDDVDSDARAGADLEAYRQTNIQAVICVPLHKAGKLAAAMAVHQTTARHWTRDEIELVQNVVSRCWETIERTKAARALEVAAERLALAVTAANLGDWSWDSASDLVTLSQRAADIFGVLPGPDLTWTTLQQLVHEDDREHTRHAVERAVAARAQYEVDYRVVRADGTTVWVSAKGLAQYGASGAPSGLFGVVQDITARKKLERDLRQRAEELSAADRKKDEFIALLAHELRNPLAPLRAGLQLMKLGDEGAVARARVTMERQLSHMVRLIDDLLDVSRMTSNRLHLQKAQVLLSDVISNTLEAVSPALDAAGHQLTVSLPPEAVCFDADLVRLAQVFGNLLSNSIKYTPPGGHIWLSAKVQGSEAVVSVTDTGIGIPAEALPRVFDMFSQVDRAVERTTGGLGIGLALVKGLVETHGGTVAVESPGVGQGSTFTVRLPIVAAEIEPRAGDVAESRTIAARPRRKVVVADDSQDGVEAMADLLEALGNEVHTARDGLDALAVIERVRPDLVLMDIGMPRLNGLDATRQLRALPWGGSVTVVALTGWGQDADRERSRAAGCDGHLVKPVDLRLLEQLLDDLAQRQAL